MVLVMVVVIGFVIVFVIMYSVVVVVVHPRRPGPASTVESAASRPAETFAHPAFHPQNGPTPNLLTVIYFNTYAHFKEGPVIISEILSELWLLI